MKSSTIITILLVVIALLVGVLVGVLYVGKIATPSVPPLPMQNNQNSLGAKAPGQNLSNMTKAAPVKPYSPSEYWISNDVSEQNQKGYASWIVLQQGGQIIIEECLAPYYDHSKIDKRTTLIPTVDASCNQILNGVIQNISGNKLNVQTRGASELQEIEFSLSKTGNNETLKLNYKKHVMNMNPGDKNLLTDNLKNLPSIKKKYNEYIEAGFKK